MRKWIVLFAAMLLAGQAGAKSIDWHGTVEIDLGALETMVLQGSGVATVNDSSGSAHLSTLRVDGGFTRVCVIQPGCGLDIDVVNTVNSGNTGVGLGLLGRSRTKK
jgi:hypothetical protein